MKYQLKGTFFLDWFHLWIFPLISLLRNTDIADINLHLDKSEQAGTNGYLAAKTDNDIKVKIGRTDVLKVLVQNYGIKYAFIGIWKLVWAAFTWLGAYYFLIKTLEYLNKTNTPTEGYLFAMALGLSSIGSSIAIHQLYAQCSKMGIQIKAALTVMIYRKSLVIFRIDGGAGEVINLLTTDVARIVDAVINLHFLWSAFVEAALIVVLSFIVIGYSAFITLGIVLLILPIQMYLGHKTSQYQVENTKITTERVHVMSEILTAIKLIKFYAWELPFSIKIKEIREKEVQLIKNTMRLKAINFAVVFGAPVLVALLCLTCFKYTSGRELTSSIGFTILSVFNTLRYPFLMLPLAVKSYTGSKLALKRLDAFLNLSEVEGMETRPRDDTVAIEISNSSYAWDDEGNSFLDSIDLRIDNGELIAVVGDVGSGKSSLLAAIMGQMKQTKGSRMNVYGSVSYVPQEAWLLNVLLRENIVFGKEFNKDLYDETIDVCALTRDLGLLVAGDETEIAERGSNLSGGQKQRVSLARAVYNDGDILLLDDPLSAVDQNVGRHIFEKCLLGRAKKANKTVLFVTHQLQYLNQVDKVVLMKDGRISNFGTYNELMETDLSFQHLINTHVVSGDVDDDIMEEGNENIDQLNIQDQNQMSILKTKEVNEKTVTKMIERNQLSVINGQPRSAHNVATTIQRNQMSVHSYIEESVKYRQRGHSKSPEKGALVEADKSTTNMGFNDFKLYLQAGKGTFLTLCIILFFFLVHGVRISSDFWLRLWIPDSLKTTNAVYLGTYAAFIILFTVGVLARGLVFAYDAAIKAHVLHDKMFNSVMRAPMAFFDRTPIGRILGAFSKHQFHIDDTMPDALMQSLQYAPLAIGALVIISAFVHWPNVVTVVAVLLVGAAFLAYGNMAENKLKQMEAISKPSLYAHLTATLEGLFSIRAYHVEKRFDDVNLGLIDYNAESLYALQAFKTCTAFYLDILTSLVIFFTALYIVIYQGNSSKAITGANAGLALSNALQLLVFLQWTVRMLGDVQSQLSSVGQLVYYGNEIPEEAPDENEDTKPPPQWPTHGSIEFNNVVLRYHPLGVNVLKNVSFKIGPKQKIGIVGRTGSGKSTLLISLLRIVEAAEGSIQVDGVDIAKLGLRDLRTKVAIIPQEPVLFVGSIRSNLDPFHMADEDAIWRALAAVHLHDKIKSMPNQLDSIVIENGKNFSLGQRQLFCIARAILSNTKILVLDEATAAIDMGTDLLIQNAIKKNFSEMTVLTIAHRLNTIIESDKVMVMDGGRVLEFDEPIKLLNNQKSSFSDLVSQTGPASAKRLTEIAQKASVDRGNDPSAVTNALSEVFEMP